MNEAQWQEIELRLTNIIRRELSAMIDVLERRAEREGDQQRRRPQSAQDARVLEILNEQWRDTHKPVATSTVAGHLYTTPRQALRILKDMADRKLIVLLPGRGSRISGKWLPTSASAQQQPSLKLAA